MTDATPTTGRRWLPFAVILLIAAIGAGGYLVWDRFLRGDDVAPTGSRAQAPARAEARARPPLASRPPR